VSRRVLIFLRRSVVPASKLVVSSGVRLARFCHPGWMIGRPQSFDRVLLPDNVLFHFGNVPIDLRKVLCSRSRDAFPSWASFIR
jgi:hypothetical protein